MKTKMQFSPIEIKAPEWILIEETIRRFGYNPELLKASSQKLVVSRCILCGSLREKPARSARKQNKCLGCSNKNNACGAISRQKRSKTMKARYASGYLHPMTGRPKSKKAIEALKLRNASYVASELTREKLSLANRGSGNGFYGKKHSPESLAKMSVAAKLNAKRGKSSNFYGKCYHGKGEWYITASGDKVWLRSSYELAYAKHLDKNNIKWLHEPRAFPVEFFFNGISNEGTYRPDFYLCCTDEYIEIKGFWRDDAKPKYDAFVKKHPNIKISVLGKKELIGLGIDL